MGSLWYVANHSHACRIEKKPLPLICIKLEIFSIFYHNTLHLHVSIMQEKPFYQNSVFSSDMVFILQDFVGQKLVPMQPYYIFSYSRLSITRTLQYPSKVVLVMHCSTYTWNYCSLLLLTKFDLQEFYYTGCSNFRSVSINKHVMLSQWRQNLKKNYLLFCTYVFHIRW